MAGKIKDLTGERFGRLVVVGLDRLTNRTTYWRCKCDCEYGGEKIVSRNSRSNNIKI